MTRERPGALERFLLNNFQRDFPLCPHPYEELAERLAIDAITVTRELKRLLDNGSISRIGPVFRPNTVGASTLAAVCVPASRLLQVAECVSRYPEVNHNYEREHRYNLWFVVNAASETRREAVLDAIVTETRLEVMSLPLVRDYYIDLGFEIDFSDEPGCVDNTPTSLRSAQATGALTKPVSYPDLIPLLQEGLSLSHAPYAEIGDKIGLSESTVLQQIRNMVAEGTIKRFGVVVRHHELGYRANAMCVWDIVDGNVDQLGRRLAEVPYVTLCYRRPRHLPHWPYNLFCMIHGKDRETVRSQVNQINEQFGLGGAGHDVLFSGRRFKQRGARFEPEPDLKDGHIAYG